MEFGILGPLQVASGGAELAIGGRKERAFLAGLLVARGRPLSTDRLGRMLWSDDPPDSFPHALEVYASALRKVFRASGEQVVLERSPAGYRLDLTTHTLDAVEFERLAASAGDAGGLDLRRARDARRAALALWRGPALADFGPLPWVLEARERLRALQLDVRRALLETELDLGRHAEVLAELTAVAAENPLHEELQRLLMVCLYRCGRQAESSDVYHRLRRRLRDEAGMEPGARIQGLLVDILRQSEELDAAEHPRGNLPVAITSFVSRQDEIAHLAGLIASGRRLVTITGAGGMGKTRLAVELARRLAPEFEGGAWLVELASVTRPGQVADGIASVLGVHPRGETAVIDQVAAALRTRRLLLVVDNCEHVLSGAAPAVSSLLKGAPQVVVVVTSRQPLGCAGEVVWRIPPLAVPDVQTQGTAADLTAFAGCALFLDRARQTHPGYRIDDADAPAVATLVRRLDGMPLALELAAAQVAVLDLPSMLQRMDQALELLRGRAEIGGHDERTLTATFEWSYQLLDDGEKELFARLSVFEGSFSLDAAESVCSGAGLAPKEIGRLVAGLVVKSMVAAQQSDHGMRYRLLEVLKHFARDKLDARRQRMLDRRFSEHLLGWVGDAATRVHGPGGVVWLDRAALELDNVDALLARLRSQDPARFCSLVLAWAPVWVATWRFAQRTWIQEAEATAQRRSDRMAGPLAAQLARLVMFQGDLTSAEAAVQRGLDAATATDDGVLRVRLLWTLGAVRGAEERYEQARAVNESALELAGRLVARGGPDPALLLAMAGILNNLADSYCEDEPERALHLASRALEVQHGLADSFLSPVSLATIAYARICQGHVEEARATVLEVINAAGVNPLWLAMGATVATLVLAAEHRFESALRAYSVGERLVEMLHGVLAPGTATRAADSTMQRVRGVLGPQKCEAINAEIATMGAGELAAVLTEELSTPGLRIVAT